MDEGAAFRRSTGLRVTFAELAHDGAPQRPRQSGPAVPEPRRPAACAAHQPDSWRGWADHSFGPPPICSVSCRPWPPCCAGSPLPCSWPSVGGTVAMTLAILVPYALLALALGRRSGFLHAQGAGDRHSPCCADPFGWLLMPAFVEELLFRVALLPHPLEGEGLAGTLAWGLLEPGAVCESTTPWRGAPGTPTPRGCSMTHVFWCSAPCWGWPALSPTNLSGFDLAATADPLAGGHGLARALQGHRRLRPAR